MIDADRILILLGDIKGDMGELKANARIAERDRQEMKKLLEDHVAVDLAVASRVSSLEHSRTNLRGMVVGFSLVASALGTAATMLIKSIPWSHL